MKRRRGPRRQAYSLRELHSDNTVKEYHQLLSERDAKDVEKLLKEWLKSGKILQYSFKNVDKGEVTWTLPVTFPVGPPMKHYVTINFNTGFSQVNVDPKDAVAAFDFIVQNPDEADAALVEFSISQRPAVPTAKILAVKSKGYVIGPWEKNKKKLLKASGQGGYSG
jgi:hypothetical protein